jgi:TonB family protein
LTGPKVSALAIRPEYGNRDLSLRPKHGLNVNYAYMRVLLVDQDASSNEAVARSLREQYVVDAVTTKGDCLDLLRSNAYEVIVAGERLNDGSGLELLGQIGKRWPSVLRVFAADQHRLQLLRGRLGPFALFQTLTYPIDPDRLLATLTLAEAAQDAHADTSDIQHVELSSELPAEQQQEEATEEPVQQPEAVSAPVPEARAVYHGSGTCAPKGHRGAGRPASVERSSSKPQSASSQRARPSQQVPSPRAGADHPSRRSGVSQNSSSSPSDTRQGRARGAARRPPPVRFPPLEPPEGSPVSKGAARPASSRFGSDSFAETSAMARAARSNLDPLPEESDATRKAILFGVGAAIVLGIVVLGFKVFSKGESAPHVTAQVAQPPRYPAEVTDLVAQIEASFKDDDYKSARVEVEKLQQLAPSHPRVPFFESLIAQRDESTKVAEKDSAHSGNGRTGKRSSQGSRTGPAPSSAAGSESSALTAKSAGSANTGPLLPETPVGLSKSSPESDAGSHSQPSTASNTAAQDTAAASIASAASGSAASGSAASGSAASGSAASGSAASASATPASPAAAASTAASASASGAASASAPASAPASATPAPAPAPTPVARAPAPAAATPARTNSDEPPSVIQEARLIRRVTPDYPSAARRDGIEGSVDLDVTVSAQGLVKEVSVAHAEPADVFDKAALAAVRKWKYDPRFVDGLPAEAQLKVHLDFKPGQ